MALRKAQRKQGSYVSSRWRQVALALALLGWTCSAANAKTRVFLLGGQSNMSGQGKIAELTGPLNIWNTPQDDVKFWDDTGLVSPQSDWISLQHEPAGTNSNVNYGFGSEFGPELSFGRAMADALPNDDIYLIKHALGGTNLISDWKPSNGGGTQYNLFRNKVHAALANLDNANIDYEISGMLWMQGESDAINTTHAAAYEANLTTFIASVRSEFNTPDMPFILGRIIEHSYYETTPVGGNATVRAAQVAVANDVEGVYWVDTENLSRCCGNSHYDGQGQIDFGELLAAEALTIIPEPSSCSLLILGAAGLLAAQRRRVGYSVPQPGTVPNWRSRIATG